MISTNLGSAQRARRRVGLGLLPDGPDIAPPPRHLFHPQTGERIT